MTQEPQIVIHESHDAPKGHRFIGAFYINGKRGTVGFFADERADLEMLMQDFWMAEQEKLARSQALKLTRFTK